MRTPDIKTKSSDDKKVGDAVTALTENVARARKNPPFKAKPGSWMDEWGACKVCDGEIPYGHTPECAIYKMEQKLAKADAMAKAANTYFHGNNTLTNFNLENLQKAVVEYLK